METINSNQVYSSRSTETFVRKSQTQSFICAHNGGEEIPAGGWRGGEEIPAGGWRGGEEIPAGGWRSYITTDVYRTEDGQAHFEFGFIHSGGNIEIDILYQPGYGYRIEDPHTTHRLSSDRGGYRICFGDPSVSNNMSSARKWAAQWAELTWDYIINGNPFPNS